MALWCAEPNQEKEDEGRMIVTIFRSRLRPEHVEEYYSLAGSVYALAEKMPGFRSAKTFQAEDGERVTIVEFESWETHNAWRDHPEHRIAQQLGRERFYAEFAIQVSEVSRQYSSLSSSP